MHLSLEGLIEDGVAWVVLDVLPAGIAMSETQPWSRNTNDDFTKRSEQCKGKWVTEVVNGCSYHFVS